MQINDPNLGLYLPLHQLDSGTGSDLVTNGNFETGDPPTGWTLDGAGATLEQSTEQVKSGTYSAKLTRAGTNCVVYQDYTDFAKYKGLKVTISGWVYATVADRAKIYIWDGVSSTSSSYHSGVAGWEQLSATATISTSATTLQPVFCIQTGDTSAYFDEIIMSADNCLMSRDAYGHLCQVTGSLWTPQGRVFDGDDVIVVPNATSLNPTSAITVIVWVNPDSGIAATKSIISKQNSSSSGYYMDILSDYTITFGYRGLATPTVTSSSAISASIYSHLAGVYDGSNLIIYINGVPTIQATSGTAVASTLDLHIGRYAGSAAQYFLGKEGEVRLYSKASSQLEIDNDRLDTKWRYL